jgi:hypothetical protein
MTVLMPNLTFRKCSGRDSDFCTVQLRFQWVGFTLTFLAVTTAVQKNCVFLRIRREFSIQEKKGMKVERKKYRGGKEGWGD